MQVGHQSKSCFANRVEKALKSSPLFSKYYFKACSNNPPKTITLYFYRFNGKEYQKGE
jgi:hypothetical protein